MEYYRGGNLFSLLSNHDDQFSEEITRFYTAEMILAIDSLHKLGYIHRDIKYVVASFSKFHHISFKDPTMFYLTIKVTFI